MSKVKCALSVFLLFVLFTSGYAQGRRYRRFLPYSSVSIGAGTSTYFGDLANYKHPFRSLTTLPRWNIGAAYSRQLTDRFSVRAMFTWIRIIGDDYTYSKSDITKFSAEYIRNLHFRNDVKELSISGVYNFIADDHNSDNRAVFTPYIFGGVALIVHKPEALTPTWVNNGAGDYPVQQWVSLQPLHTEGQGLAEYKTPYSLVSVAVPLGFGVRYRLSDALNLDVEVGYRYTFSDYLDDVAGVYAQPGDLAGLSKIMADRRFDTEAIFTNSSRLGALPQLYQNEPSLFTTDRRGGTGKLKDSYLLTNLSIHYIFPVPIKCP